MKRHFRGRRIKSGAVFSILGIILMLASMASVYWWETKGRDKLLYGEVVVLNQSVEAETTITSDMLEFLKIDPDNFIEGAIACKKEVIGKSTIHYIPKYSQLALAFFIDENMEVVKEDKYIFTVPADWIVTFPNSLRRGDTIYFYPVKIVGEKEEENKSFNSLSNIKTAKDSDLVKSEVAYLKDSGNREVVSTAGEARYDGSANISSIEIIVDYEDISYLQSLAERNWKFIILYKGNIN